MRDFTCYNQKRLRARTSINIILIYFYLFFELFFSIIIITFFLVAGSKVSLREAFVPFIKP